LHANSIPNLEKSASVFQARNSENTPENFGKRKRKDIRKNSTKITLAPSLRIEKKAFMSILIYTNGDKFKSISFEIELVTVSGAFLHRGRVL